MFFRNALRSWVYPPEILLSEQFNFGHREILIAANKLQENTLFLASVQHGWDPGPAIGKRILTRRMTQYSNLVWSKRIQEFLSRNGNYISTPIGAPWSHLLRACGINPYVPKTSSNDSSLPTHPRVLYFPSHSSHGFLAIHQKNASFLNSLTLGNKVKVCLFWSDFVNPKVRELHLREGYEITCAGYRGSSGGEVPWSPLGGRILYLPSILEMIERAEIVVLDTIGTALWYAISLGKRIVLLNGSEKFQNWSSGSGVDMEIDVFTLMAKLDSNFPSIKLKEVQNSNNELLDYALSELGWKSTPNFLTLQKTLTAPLPQLNSQLIDPIRNFIISRQFQNESNAN